MQIENLKEDLEQELELTKGKQQQIENLKSELDGKLNDLNNLKNQNEVKKKQLAERDLELEDAILKIQKL